MFSASARRFARAIALAVVGLWIFCAVVPSTAEDWKGTTELRDGIEYVHNPQDGRRPPITLELDELWRIGGDSNADEEFFGLINRIDTDEQGNVYLLDRQLSEVKVFSPDGQYLKTIGREGEGPGEFRQALDMFFLADGRLAVLQLAPGRIVTFTRDGEPAGDHPIPRSETGITPALVRGHGMGDNLLLVISQNEQRDGAIDIHRSLVLVDSQGQEQKRLLDSVRELSFVDFGFDETVWRTFDERWAVSPDGHLFAVDQYLNYEIIEWDPLGNRQRVITRKFEHFDRSDEQKQEMHDIFDGQLQNQLPRYTIKVSDYDPDVTGLFPRADGSLWVLSSRGGRAKPEGSVGIFDVFDAEGRFTREVTLRGEGDPLDDGYYFLGDRFYVVVGQLEANIASRGGHVGADAAAAEEPEPISVICYRLPPRPWG